MRNRIKRESSPLRSYILALALLVVALATTDLAVAGTSQRGELLERVTSEIFPTRLTRSQPAPITLRIGFSSKAKNRPETPELSQVSLELSRRVAFQTEGLPSCPLARLLSSYRNARHICAGSLVGHGFVVTEVSLPGKAPIRIDGRLLAFYNEEGLGTQSNPYILAQVITGGEEPLTYVLPFQIERTPGAFATRLIIHHMLSVRGKPLYGGAYQLRGIYGRISSFEITLHRLFRRHGKRESLVSTDCPDPHPTIDEPLFPPVKVTLEYANGIGIEGSADWRCEVAG